MFYLDPGNSHDHVSINGTLTIFLMVCADNRAIKARNYEEEDFEQRLFSERNHDIPML